MQVSVALCTYNGEKYIEEQLNSILAQTVGVNEIVISDDGSTDGTLNVVQAILSKSNIPFKILKNAGQKGVCGNFFNAISACSNEIIFTCDQDDVWKKDKVEKMIAPFENNENVLLVFSDATLVDGNLKPLGSNLWKTLSFKPLKDSSKMFDVLLGLRVVTGACMAVRRDFAFFCGIARGGWLHDAWFAINASVRGDVIPINEELIFYRQHDNNTVGAKKIGSKERVVGYFDNIKVMPEVWEERYQRFTAFKQFANENLTKEQIEKLDKCIAFWSDLVETKQKNKWQGLCTVIKNAFNGNYKKFYTGARGAFRDCLVILTRRKNR